MFRVTDKQQSGGVSLHTLKLNVFHFMVLFDGRGGLQRRVRSVARRTLRQQAWGLRVMVTARLQP